MNGYLLLPATLCAVFTLCSPPLFLCMCLRLYARWTVESKVIELLGKRRQSQDDLKKAMETHLKSFRVIGWPLYFMRPRLDALLKRLEDREIIRILPNTVSIVEK